MSLYLLTLFLGKTQLVERKQKIVAGQEDVSKQPTSPTQKIVAEPEDAPKQPVESNQKIVAEPEDVPKQLIELKQKIVAESEDAPKQEEASTLSINSTQRDAPIYIHHQRVVIDAMLDGVPISTNLMINIKSRNENPRVELKEMWVDGERLYCQHKKA
ncbi:hypothetical protein M3Y97_00408100 [Aphelenchoides bicaudatus]|nr:hypothetical protein M3Y97_00408100 [Aphelenchoides bicaudatus]